MHESIGKDMSDLLPALHELSGCDYTSAFFGIGKQKMYKVVKKSDHFKDVLASMGRSINFEMDIFTVIQEIFPNVMA
jgi:flavodoxin